MQSFYIDTLLELGGLAINLKVDWLNGPAHKTDSLEACMKLTLVTVIIYFI